MIDERQTAILHRLVSLADTSSTGIPCHNSTSFVDSFACIYNNACDRAYTEGFRMMLLRLDVTEFLSALRYEGM